MATKKQSKNQPDKTQSKGFEVADIRVSYGMTLNIGNYESFRADAAVTIRANKQCKSQDEADMLRDAMYEEGWKTVKAELTAQVKAVREKTRPKEE